MAQSAAIPPTSDQIAYDALNSGLELTPGVPTKSLPYIPDEKLRKRLLPKSIKIDSSLNDEIAHIWHEIRTIDRGSTNLPVLRAPESVPRVRNESDADRFVRMALVEPIVCTVNRLAETAREIEPSHPAADSRLVEVLRRAIPPLNARLVGDYVAATRAAHRLNNEVAPDAAFDLYRVPNAAAIAKAKKRTTDSVPDITLCCIGEVDAADVSGGIPFLVLEIKDPSALTNKVLTDLFLRPRSYLAADQHDLIGKDGSIPVRALLCHKDSSLDSDGRRGYGLVSQLYDSMLTHRQTYGAMTTAEGTLSLKILWDHPEPGQHVLVSLLKCTENTVTPKWTDSRVIQGQFHYCFGLGALQLAKGLVPKSTFERVLVWMTRHANNDHTSFESDANDKRRRDEPSSGPITRNKREAGALGSTPDPRGAKRGHTHHITSQNPDPINAAFLANITDPAVHDEVCRFLDLDESVVSLKFHKSELLKVLCSANPPQPSVARKIRAKDRRQKFP